MFQFEMFVDIFSSTYYYPYDFVLKEREPTFTINIPNPQINFKSAELNCKPGMIKGEYAR